jgi:hypothetical protein
VRRNDLPVRNAPTTEITATFRFGGICIREQTRPRRQSYSSHIQQP